MTILVCAALLATFAAIASLSSRSKSPTYDEPLHAVSAYLQTHFDDRRVDPEDPPLWKYWAALASRRDTIVIPLDSPEYARVLDDLWHEWKFTVDAMYRTDENAARSDELVQRMRTMMIVLGVAVGAMTAWWAWQLSGAVAAMTAATLFALCPNFLAHAPLVKNDVPLTLCALGLVLAVWRAGKRLTVLNALAVALLCAAVVTVKFSGLLFGPVVALLLLVRALLPQPWPTFWRTVERRMEKVIVAVLLAIFAAGVSYAGIWASYGFHFVPSPRTAPAAKFDMKPMIVYASMAEYMVRNGRLPTPEETETLKWSRVTKTILTMEDMRFLPQPWLYGLLYTYQSALVRKTFLLGGYSNTGWWYYFPVAIAAKTPLATLLAGVAALVLMSWIATTRGGGWKPSLIRAAKNWTVACTVIPPAIFLISAMRSNLNLGLRHILPIYPFIFIGIAVATAVAWQHWRLATKIAGAVLAGLLATETLASFPNYIPFFNAAAGGARGGLRILGDSNLDWGQDLKLLAQWQQRHPGANLYLVYFGIADPWAYGIDYVNFPGGYPFGEKRTIRGDPGFLAISATMLQGIYNDPDLREAYSKLLEVEPVEVLGGSIYIYRWPPPPPRLK